jgi:hypothetical protein
VQYSYDLTVNSFRKSFVDEKRVHMAQIESWENKNIDGFYTKTTPKGGFSKHSVAVPNFAEH